MGTSTTWLRPGAGAAGAAARAPAPARAPGVAPGRGRAPAARSGVRLAAATRLVGGPPAAPLRPRRGPCGARGGGAAGSGARDRAPVLALRAPVPRGPAGRAGAGGARAGDRRRHGLDVQGRGGRRPGAPGLQPVRLGGRGLPRARAARRRGLVRRRLPAHVGERALPAAPAHRRLPPPAPALAELPRPPSPRRHDVARHERRGGHRGLRALGRGRRALGGRAAGGLRGGAVRAVVAAGARGAGGGAPVLAGLALLLAPHARGLARAAAGERLARGAGRGEPVERLARAGLRGRRPRGGALPPPRAPDDARPAHRDAHPGPVRPARQPDRGRRRARGAGGGDLRAEPGPAEPGWAAGVHGVPQSHLFAAAGAHEPGELAVLGRGGRRAGDRAARRAARRDGAARGAAARAPARRGRG